MRIGVGKNLIEVFVVLGDEQRSRIQRNRRNGSRHPQTMPSATIVGYGDRARIDPHALRPAQQGAPANVSTQLVVPRKQWQTISSRMDSSPCNELSMLILLRRIVELEHPL